MPSLRLRARCSSNRFSPGVRLLLFSFNKLLFTSVFSSIKYRRRIMADSPQFQLMPQVVPIYRPQPPLTQPPPPPNTFSMPTGQPIFPMPPQFGYPPMAWSPVHQYPPPPPLMPQQPAPDHIEEDNFDVRLTSTSMFNNNNNNNNNNYSSNKNISSADNSKIDLELQSPQRQNTQSRQMFSRNASNKVNTTIRSGCVRGGQRFFIFVYIYFLGGEGGCELGL